MVTLGMVGGNKSLVLILLGVAEALQLITDAILDWNI